MAQKRIEVVEYGPSETQERFILSDAWIVGIIGPEGEGKTWAGLWAGAFHSLKHDGKRLSAALIRDTFENIKVQTHNSINEAAPASMLKWGDGGKSLQFRGEIGGSRFHVDWDMMGIDDVKDETKLQGGEWGLIWLEEPAPLAAKSNAGIAEQTFNKAVARSSRQRGFAPRCQITMNPSDQDHWTYQRLVEDPIDVIDKDTGLRMWTEVFNIPPGENTHLDPETRVAIRESYRGDKDQYERYVQGRFAYITLGEPVIPNYNEQLHRSKGILLPNPNLTTYRLWDGGLNPTCLFMQITSRGRFFFLDTLRGENIGARQLCRQQVKPLLDLRYRDCKQWVDILDPAMFNREQSDSSKSAADVIKEELNCSPVKGEMNWDNRKATLLDVFDQMVDGEPRVLISKHEGILHRALRGGWHYDKDNSGNLIKDKPVKDIHSHPGDAMSHGMARILRQPVVMDMKERVREENRKRMERKARRKALQPNFDAKRWRM